MGRFWRRFAPRVGVASVAGLAAFAGLRRVQLHRAYPTPLAEARPACENSEYFTRDTMLARLCSEEFDIVVVGGGVTGLFAAIEARRRGKAVALVEAVDFGFGASTSQPPLLTSGWSWCQRAFRQRDWSLTRAAWTEAREHWRLSRDMPECVVQQRVAIFSAHHLELVELIATSAIFAFINSFFSPCGFTVITPSRALRDFPNASNDVESLVGGVAVPCAVLDVRRLLRSLVATAAREGVVVVNHCPATGMHLRPAVARPQQPQLQQKDSRLAAAGEEVAERNAVGAVQCEDLLSPPAESPRIAVRLRDGGAVINTAGAWSDQVRGFASSAPPRFNVHLNNISFVVSADDFYKGTAEATGEPAAASLPPRAIVASSPFVDQPSLCAVPLRTRQEPRPQLPAVLVGTCAAELPALAPAASTAMSFANPGASSKEELLHVRRAAQRLGLHAGDGSVLRVVGQLIPLVNPRERVASQLLMDSFAVDGESTTEGIVTTYGGGLALARHVASVAVDAVLGTSTDRPPPPVAMSVAPPLCTLHDATQASCSGASGLLAESLSDVIFRRADIGVETDLLAHVSRSVITDQVTNVRTASSWPQWLGLFSLKRQKSESDATAGAVTAAASDVASDGSVRAFAGSGGAAAEAVREAAMVLASARGWDAQRVEREVTQALKDLAALRMH